MILHEGMPLREDGCGSVAWKNQRRLGERKSFGFGLVTRYCRYYSKLLYKIV